MPDPFRLAEQLLQNQREQDERVEEDIQEYKESRYQGGDTFITAAGFEDAYILNANISEGESVLLADGGGQTIADSIPPPVIQPFARRRKIAIPGIGFIYLTFEYYQDDYFFPNDPRQSVYWQETLNDPPDADRVLEIWRETLVDFSNDGRYDETARSENFPGPPDAPLPQKVPGGFPDPAYTNDRLEVEQDSPVTENDLAFAGFPIDHLMLGFCSYQYDNFFVGLVGVTYTLPPVDTRMRFYFPGGGTATIRFYLTHRLISNTSAVANSGSVKFSVEGVPSTEVTLLMQSVFVLPNNIFNYYDGPQELQVQSGQSIVFEWNNNVTYQPGSNPGSERNGGFNYLVYVHEIVMPDGQTLTVDFFD